MVFIEQFYKNINIMKPAEGQKKQMFQVIWLILNQLFRSQK